MNRRLYTPMMVLVLAIAAPVAYTYIYVQDAKPATQNALPAKPARPAAPPPMRSDGTSMKLEVSSHIGPAVELTAKPVRIDLSFVGDTGAQKGLDAALPAILAQRHVHIVVNDLRTVSEPGTLFDLYLDLPDGETPKRSDLHHIGSINFYEAARPTKDQAGRPPTVMTFDITNPLRNMLAKKMLTPASTITIVANGTPAANAKPTIGSIEIIAQ